MWRRVNCAAWLIATFFIPTTPRAQRLIRTSEGFSAFTEDRGDLDDIDEDARRFKPQWKRDSSGKVDCEVEPDVTTEAKTCCNLWGPE